MIEIDRLEKRYGGNRVVDDVTLTFPRGGVTSLVGANGAGKSTLLHVVARLIDASSGTVRLDGKDVRSYPSKHLARRLAILQQSNDVLARLRVGELVEFGRFPHSGGRLRADDRRAVDEAIAHMNLADLRGRFLDQLSGGERQRAFVAMILAQQTDYILLDEPLNNLDLRHSVDMMASLRRIASELDRTIVVVVHDINVASAYSDRIVAMRKGKVVADGTPLEVVRPETLSMIYDVDAAVHTIEGVRIATYYRGGTGE